MRISTPLPSALAALLSAPWSLLVAVPGVLLIAVPAASQVAPHDAISPVHAARIAAIEAELPAPVQIEGRPPRIASLEERMSLLHVPGVSVGVLEGGEVIWAKAWGTRDVGTGDPATPSTLFQAASISKPVAGMAVLRLVEEGRLDLDRDVNDYLTTWKVPAHPWSGSRPVTLRGILTHTAGLTQHGFPGYERDAPLPTVPQILDGKEPANTGPVRVDTLPGSLWRYSGGGYTVLQQLVEDVTGRAFEEVVRELVLEPAQMRHSTYEQPLPRQRWAEAAHAHDEQGARYPGDWHVYPEKAAAGLWTTPTDLLRLAREVQRARTGASARILSRDATLEMLTPGMNGWGLGFGSAEGPNARFGHGGSNAGFRALLTAWVDQGRGIAVMTNGDRGATIAQEILYAVAREYGWEGDDLAPRTRVVAAVPESEREPLAGRYAVRGLDGPLEVTLHGEGLVVRIPGREIVLLPESRDAYFEAEDGTPWHFERDEAGTVTGVRIAGSTQARRVRP